MWYDAGARMRVSGRTLETAGTGKAPALTTGQSRGLLRQGTRAWATRDPRGGLGEDAVFH